MMNEAEKADLDRLMKAGTTYTPAEEELAKGMSLIVLVTAGFTPGMAEKAWEDDAESREVFLTLAKRHAVNIRAEARAARKGRATHYKPSNTPTEKD